GVGVLVLGLAASGCSSGSSGGGGGAVARSFRQPGAGGGSGAPVGAGPPPPARANPLPVGPPRGGGAPPPPPPPPPPAAAGAERRDDDDAVGRDGHDLRRAHGAERPRQLVRAAALPGGDERERRRGRRPGLARHGADGLPRRVAGRDERGREPDRARALLG